MVKRKKLSEKKWYNGAVIACIGVAFYALLMNLGAVTAAVRSFLGNFRPIFLGIVLAYIFNSIAKYFYYKVFRWMKLGKRRWSISVILSVVLVLLAIDLLLGMLLPQLIQSIGLLSETFDSYTDAAIKWIDSGALGRMLDTQQLELRAQNAVDSISKMLSVNIPQILSAAAYYGKNLLTWFIALILSLYMLIDKKRVMAGVWRLVNLTLRKETSEKVMDFVLRCDTIMISFLVQSLLDALIRLGVHEAEVGELELMGFKTGCATHFTERGKLREYWCFDIRYDISGGRLFNLRRPLELIKDMP